MNECMNQHKNKIFIKKIIAPIRILKKLINFKLFYYAPANYKLFFSLTHFQRKAVNCLWGYLLRLEKLAVKILFPKKKNK